MTALVITTLACALGAVALLYLLATYERRVHGPSCARTPPATFLVGLLAETFAMLVAFALKYGPPPRSRGGESDAPPVVLVHGLASGPGSFVVLARRLGARGRAVTTVPHNALAGDIEAAAEQLNHGIERLLAGQKHARVDLVGHGVGGLVARAALAEGGARIGNLVTLGCPHRGTPLASFIAHRRLVQLRPGSHLLARLPSGESMAADRHVTSVASSFDAVVHPVDAAALAGTFEVRLERPGHYGLLFARRIFDIVAENLDHRVQRPIDQPIVEPQPPTA